jgi:hypothetical protein
MAYMEIMLLARFVKEEIILGSIPVFYLGLVLFAFR